MEWRAPEAFVAVLVFDRLGAARVDGLKYYALMQPERWQSKGFCRSSRYFDPLPRYHPGVQTDCLIEGCIGLRGWLLANFFVCPKKGLLLSLFRPSTDANSPTKSTVPAQPASLPIPLSLPYQGPVIPGRHRRRRKSRAWWPGSLVPGRQVRTTSLWFYGYRANNP
jgi:hypothetical protein